MSGEGKAKVQRFIEEAWNKGNMSVIDELFASDYVLHEPAEDVIGPQALAKMVKGFRDAFPDLHCTIEDQIAEGDLVATRWTLRASHEGDWMGMKPTGKPITMEGVVLHRFAAGKMTEAWDRWDMLGFMQQVGVIPELEETPA